MAFVKLASMPAPPVTRVQNIPSLSGGLNIHKSPWQLAENQSPELKNMWWEDGALRSRPAQVAVGSMIGGEEDSPCAIHNRPYNGWYVLHRGSKLFAVSEDLDFRVEINTAGITIPADVYGSFFLYGDLLYYKTKGLYVVIEEGDDYFDEVAGLKSLKAKAVEAYVPTVQIDTDPETGAGSLYQPMNRLTKECDIYYTFPPGADGGDSYFDVFYLPFSTLEVRDKGFKVSLVDIWSLEGSGTWLSKLGSYKLGSLKGRFIVTEKEDGNAISNRGSNVLRIRIRYETEETQKGTAAFDSCNIAGVYGAGEALCAVFAGCEQQPNAYFWSANTNVAMDPGYVPYENYNLSGAFSDPIVAFGEQQNKLVIFQKNRLGAATFGTADVDGRTYITMDYRTINALVGCDIPGSVQLVENNLVFANTKTGVMTILDTTSADENNIIKISENIERPSDKPGLLFDLQRCKAPPTSIDDGDRYWLVVDSHAWVWDYRLGGSSRRQENLSWFYFDRMQNPAGWFLQGSNASPGFLGRDGIVRRFAESTPDTGEDFEKVITLPVSNFGTYEVLKNVTKAIFAFDDSSEGQVNVEYITDYGRWVDRTPLVCRGGEDLPFAEVFVRKPRCLNVRHFMCRLTNNGRGDGVAFASAQIHYTMQGADR